MLFRSPDNDDEFLAEVLYSVLCRQTSNILPLQKRVPQVIAEYAAAGKDISDIPCTEFFAPKSIDFTRGRFVCVDGLYQSYLLIPSHGYKSEVMAGWISLLVNAGDGIDVDLFLTKQPKDRMVQKLGQQLRINHSKIKDASDTNTNFDSLDDAIKSGYFPIIKLCGTVCGNSNEGIHIVEILVFRDPSFEEISAFDGIVKAVKVGVCVARILDLGVIDTKLLTELLYHSVLGLLGEEQIYVDTVTGIDE